MDTVTFEEFPKLARLSRQCVITEKLDGTNAQVIITEGGEIAAASRNRLITPEDDNAGFARFVAEHAEGLKALLGVGRHFGEWWGEGIQRRYGIKGKRFSLFNTARWEAIANWNDSSPGYVPQVTVVPVLYKGVFSTQAVESVLGELESTGSVASPGFMRPEGVVVWHEAARKLFKKTLGGDGHKGAEG